MSLYAGIGNATPIGDRSFFDPGDYECKIVSVENKTSQNPERMGQPFLLVTLEVIASNNGTPVGYQGSWWRDFKYRDQALGEIKAFVMAAYGCDLKDATQVAWFEANVSPQLEGIMAAATSEQGYLNGRVVRVSARQPNPEKEYVKLSFAPKKEEALPPGPAAAVAPPTPTPAGPGVAVPSTAGLPAMPGATAPTTTPTAPALPALPPLPGR